MGGGYRIVRDSQIVGLGPLTCCSHCNNTKWFEVRQRWTMVIFVVAFIPAPTPRIWKNFIVRCGVCHYGFNVRKDDKEKLLQLLMEGMPELKRRYEHLDKKNQNEILKGLNRNKLNHLAAELCFGEQLKVA